MPGPALIPAHQAPVLLYDGACGLCHGLVRFLLRRDRRGRIRFAPLQGEFARSLFDHQDRQPRSLDTVYLWLDGDPPVLLDRSAAVLGTLRLLAPPWRALAACGRLLPRRLADRCYDWVAARRYRWFGTLAGCPLPAQEQRERFFD